MQQRTLGSTLSDTADSYHRSAGEVGHNESLITKARHSVQDSVAAADPELTADERATLEEA